ncbi:MAG: cupin domain-containing protein [Nocardioides sp.]|uniref:cupin domain-containing protein n=1 Tax=Nocardioides sp. TaxID=35761 RepID=UPI0039E25DC1
MEPRATDALSLALDDLPLDADAVVEGAPSAGVATLHQLGGAEIGIWELTAGTVTDTEADEVFAVIAGSGTVTFADGESVALRPGVVVRLRAGEQTRWTVTETLRKVWVAP